MEILTPERVTGNSGAEISDRLFAKIKGKYFDKKRLSTFSVTSVRVTKDTHTVRIVTMKSECGKYQEFTESFFYSLLQRRELQKV